MKKADKKIQFYILYNLTPELYQHNSIENLNISKRSKNALTRGNINSISDLLLCNILDLERIRNIGVSSITEILKAIENINQDIAKTGSDDGIKVTVQNTNFQAKILAHKIDIINCDFSFKDKELFNNDELEIIKQYEHSFEILDKKTISQCLNYPDKIKQFQFVLKLIYYSLNGYDFRRKQLLHAINSLSPNKRKKLAQNYLKAYFSNEDVYKEYLIFYPDTDASLKCINVKEVCLSPDAHKILLEFYMWCNFDIEKELRDFTLKLYKLKYSDAIIRMRSNGISISDISKILNISVKDIYITEIKTINAFSRIKSDYDLLKMKITAEFDSLSNSLKTKVNLFLEEINYLQKNENVSLVTKDMLPESIGKKIQYFRELYEYSENEFAEKLNISLDKLQDFESNKLLPSNNTIKQISYLINESPKIFHLEEEIKNNIISIGQKIQYFRKCNDLSPHQFIKTLGLKFTRSLLASYENDLQIPRINELEIIASFNGFSISIFDLKNKLNNSSQAELIKFYRRSANVTIRKLSELTGIEISRLTHLESGGSHRPKISEIMKIANALNIKCKKLGQKKLTTGEHIKLLRENLKLSQHDFGEQVGISFKKIFDYEKDSVTPTYSDITSIAHFCNVKPKEILPSIKSFTNNFSVGEKINFYRIQKNLTRPELAEKCCITVKRLRRIENNIANATNNELCIIVEKLNIKISELE